MLYSSFRMFSHVLTDKQIPIPSIDLQPTFVLPPISTVPDYEMSWYVKHFHSLNFSIDYHFDESENTLAMIRQNFDFSESPKIVLKKYLSKSAAGFEGSALHGPREVPLPTSTISKGIFKLFVGSGPHDEGKELLNLNIGCQMVSLYMDYNDMMNKQDKYTTPFEDIAECLEIADETDHENFGFQFFVTIKKLGCDKEEDPYITISTDVFQIDFDEDFTRIFCVKVHEEDYFMEESGRAIKYEEIEQLVSPGAVSKMDDSNSLENPNPGTEATAL